MGESRVQATYDAVARAYDAALRDELEHKPLDRALLAAVLEVAGPGTVADIGCGPGHVTRFLAGLGAQDLVGIDLSPAMIDIARSRAPGLDFRVASMLALPVPDGSWAAAVALYSIIHLTAEERVIAFAELARTLRPGGVLLVAFHVEGGGFGAGEVHHLTEWFGAPVDLDGYFLAPATIANDLVDAGFAIDATMLREPDGAEYPSRRCYLLARRG